jgi:hypothetical protein
MCDCCCAGWCGYCQHPEGYGGSSSRHHCAEWPRCHKPALAVPDGRQDACHPQAGVLLALLCTQFLCVAGIAVHTVFVCCWHCCAHSFCGTPVLCCYERHMPDEIAVHTMLCAGCFMFYRLQSGAQLHCELSMVPLVVLFPEVAMHCDVTDTTH